jgi:hypothetical protein
MFAVDSAPGRGSMTEQDELQAAADRGELHRAKTKTNQQFLQAVAATERRWIVMQVVEVAKVQPMTPAQFKELCEFVLVFCSGVPAPETPP